MHQPITASIAITNRRKTASHSGTDASADSEADEEKGSSVVEDVIDAVVEYANDDPDGVVVDENVSVIVLVSEEDKNCINNNFQIYSFKGSKQQ